MTKAKRLSILKDNGFNVPNFIEVIDPNHYNVPFKAEKYIVRSSFSVEDAKKSFAGMFKSFGPIEKEEVNFYLRKVLRGTVESKAYAERASINKRPTAGAIIQEYIDSEFGGVCFTNHNDNVVIEVGKDPKMVTAGKGKIERYVIARNLLRVSNEQTFVQPLVADALDIESLFKKPQDIEWVYSKNNIYTLQTRNSRQTSTRGWADVSEMLSTMPTTSWDRYLAFSFESSEFRKITHQIVQNLIDLEVFNWRSIMKLAYRKPKSLDPIESFREAVINYGYYGFLNQLAEENSIGMKRVLLSVRRLNMSTGMLLDYALSKKKSLYSEIIKNPEKYDEVYSEDVEQKEPLQKLIKIKKTFSFSPREQRVANFFTMLSDIKNYGVVYHDYHISPLLKQIYNSLPAKLRKNVNDYIEIFERVGFVMPKIEREKQRLQPIYEIQHSISGIVGKDILIYVDVPPETVLKLHGVKCIISEEGGVLSHAAILAREFNIPFIAGVNDASKLLRRGDSIMVESSKDGIIIKSGKKDIHISTG